VETLSFLVPGLFGYRMDTPGGGNYWVPSGATRRGTVTSRKGSKARAARLDPVFGRRLLRRGIGAAGGGVGGRPVFPERESVFALAQRRASGFG